MKTAVIIPALNPDTKLTELVRGLSALDIGPIVVVDDGSAASKSHIFSRLESEFGCPVARHPVNRGKGAALRTGIALASRLYPGLSGYVTADADGQHLPEDIKRLSDALTLHPGCIVLGARDFSQSGVPFRSRWGNRITSFVFYVTSRVHCPDTQTGLRAIPAELAEFCLSVPGDRFEYEMNVLTAAAKKGIKLAAVPIKTVYTDKNKSSHFHPVFDSARIYAGIVRFGLASLASAAADLLFFSLLASLLFDRTPAGIFASTVLARCASGIINFTLNKFWSFESKGNTVRQAYMYAALFILQMTLSWGIVTLLSSVPASLTLLKVFADGGLFILSYFIQKKLVFGRHTL